LVLVVIISIIEEDQGKLPNTPLYMEFDNNSTEQPYL